MSEPSTVFPQKTDWEADGSHRIPFVADTGDELYKRERERFFLQGPPVLRRAGGRDTEPGRLQAHGWRRALGRHGA